MKKEVHPAGQKTSEALDNSGPMILVSNTKKWSLCSDAEERLKEAIEKRAVVLVNNSVLLKIRGRLAGVVLERKEVPGGVLEPGVWYVPDEGNIRSGIRSAFDRGKRRKIFPESTQWAKAREIDEDMIPPEELTALIKKATENLDKSSLWTIDPRGYRMRNQELDEVEYGEDSIIDFID